MKFLSIFNDSQTSFLQQKGVNMASQLSLNLEQDSQLRGGGCGRSSPKSPKNQVLRSLPLNYVSKMKQNCQLLQEKSDQLLDPFSRDEIMMSLQWFQDNRFWICEICRNDDLILKVYDAALNCFQQIISIISNYLRGSGCICYYVLEVCNDLLLIIYTYQLKNEDRYLSVELQSELLSMVDQIKQDLELNKHFWANGLNFQITLIKIALMNSRTNSKEKKEKIMNVAISGISSLLSFQISEDFTNALFDLAKYILIEKYNEFQFPIQTYEIYYFFFLLKWNIIKNIQEKNNLNDQIASLKIGYEQYVQNSDNWIVHFCWINAISDLISFRLLISQAQSFNNLNVVEQKQVWNQLINQNLIQVLSYDKSLAKVNNSITLNLTAQKSEKSLINSCIQRIQLFQKALLNQQYWKKQNFFQFYVDFTFEKHKQKEENFQISQQNQLLHTNEQLIIFQHLNQLLKGNIQSIKEQYDSFKNSFILLSDYDKSNLINFQLNYDQFEQSINQLNRSLFKLQYFLFEINFIMLIEKNRMNICQEYLFNLIKNNNNDKLDEKGKNNTQNEIKKDKKDKNIIQMEKIQQLSKEFDVVQQEWLELLKSMPIQYTEFFNLMVKFKRIIQTLSIFDKTELEQIKKQIKDDLNGSFICNTQIIAEKLYEKLQYLQLQLQNFWKFNSRLVDQKINSQLDQQIIELLKNLIQLDTIQFINKQKQKQFSQNFQTLEEMEQFDINIQNKIISMKLFKGQLIQKVYFLAKLESNMKTQMEISQQNAQQQNKQIINLEEQHSQIKNLISDQQGLIYKLFQDLQDDESVIQQMLESITPIKDQILISLSYYQSYKLNLALLLQTQIYNSLYKLKFTSQQDIQQCKNEISEYYNQYQQDEQNNNNEQELSQKDDCLKRTDFKELQNFFSQQIQEFKSQIIKAQQLIQNLDQISQLVDQNYLSLLYLKENKLQNNILDNFNQIIEQLVIKLDLDKQVEDLTDFFNNRYIKNIQLKSEMNFSFNDFKLIFCYNQKISDLQVEIDDNYQEILDSMQPQELLVERKFYDLSKDYIVRECLLFHLIKIQSQVPDKELLLICQEYIKRLWLIEKDESVRALLKNKEIVEMQKQLFSHDLKSFSTTIQEEMNQKLKQMEAYEQKIRFEGNQSYREKLQQQLSIQYEEFEEFLVNITEMSQQLDITLIFLKEMQKNIKQIKQKIEDLQESLKEISNDIRKLRGKKYSELLLIRKERVLQQAYLLELDSVYIALKTQEINPVTGEIQKTFQGSDFSELLVDEIQQNKKDAQNEGEVNQFIYEEQEKDVMLIKGQAGSGKSRSARKIEQYLWKQNKDQYDWIPIYISLPQLKNPKFNLIDQALESENYGFDKLQLKDFKEAISKQNIRVVMILDSYDEMKQDCIQSNLIQTNRLIQELDLNTSNKVKKAKFIITTRKEILTSLGYQTQFFGESIQTFKEVEIMNFDQEQSEKYLQHYVNLSIKRRIKFLYDFVKQIKQQQQDIKEFLEIWNKITDQVLNQDVSYYEDNSSQLLDDEQIENILQILKKCSAFQYVQEDQLIILKKELISLWSVNLYQQTIQNLKIEHFVQTPFMLEIIVQTLPNLSKKYKGSNEIKELFQKNFLLLKKKDNLSKKLIEKYLQQEQDEKEVQIQQNIVQLNQIENDSEDYQVQKDLKIILEQLESQRFFENYSITDIKLAEDQILKLQQIDDMKFVIPALKMKQFTIYEFYQNFIEFYHDQQIQKLRQLGKVDNVDSFTIDLIQFSESLALEMTINQITQVNYEQKGRLKLTNHYFDQNDQDNWKMQYFDDLEDEYKKLVRSSALITMKGKSYSFNHKSIQEFYVAQHINNLLNKLELVNNQFTQNSQMFLQKSSLNQSQFNISFQNYAGSLSILKQKLKYDDLIKAKLISMAKLSKKNEFTTASSNSFSLLSYLQVYLGEQDFSNIQIQNTTFIGLSFYKSNFQSSRLKGVVIDSCLFDQANLAEAQWEQLVCSEKPLLQGHQGKIIVLQYTNEGQYIITGDSNKVIKFWEVKTYQQKAEIQQITGEPQILVLSSDSHLLFIAQSNNIIESWIISDLNNIKKTGHSIRKEDTIISMQLSQNEKELYVVDKQGLVQFWDVNLIKAHSNEKDGFAIQSGDSDIKKIEFFQNGEYIASDSDDYNVRIWNVEKQQQIALIKMPSPIINLKIIQSVQYLVCITGSSYSQQYYNIWSIKSIDQPEFLFRSSKYQIHSIQFTSDDKQLLYEVEDAVIIQNTSDICNQEEYYKLNNCLCVAFSSNNNLIASGNNDQIIFWDLDTQVIINSLNHESYSIEELIFISNGTKLLSAHYSGDLKLWSVQRCVLIANYKECYQKRNITISSDSDIIAIETKRRMAIISLTQKQSQQNTNQLYYFELNPISISYDDELILHDYSNWNEQQYYVTNPGSYQQIQFENHKNKFKCGIFANQSLLFASFSEDSKIRIWTYQGLIFQKMIEIEFECQISKMQFSFDDKYLALVIDMNLIKIWEYGKQKFYELKQVIHQDTDLCFSFNSLQLAFFTNDEIKIWKFSVDEQTYIIKNDENHEIKAIASSPKVNLFATSFIQQTIIIIWDFETRQKLYTILSDEQVNSLCFSYDGEYLVSGGQILRLWNLQNFSKIKLNGASEYICDYEIKKVCSLHQTQGITVISSSRKMGKIQFKDFEFIGILEQSQRLLTRCEFSLDNQFIVGGLDKQVVIWNINNNYQIEFRHDFLNTVQSVRFCQDQKRLIVAQESDICFLDINSGNIMNVFSDLKQIKDAQTFNGDQYLYTKQEKFVKIWKLQNQPILIDYFSLPHQSVKFLQDGKFLSHCETDSITVYPIYPIQTQSKLRFIHLQQLRKIKISSNSKYILYGDWQNLILSDFKSNEVIEELSSYETFEFCPDNLNIIVIERGILMIYNIMDKKIINQLNLDEKSYRNHIQFSNDGKTLVLATSCIMLFNIEDISKPQFIGVIQDVNRLADPTISQKYLASIIKKNQIILTDLRNRKFMKSFQVKKGYSQLDDLVFFSNYEKAAYLSSNSFIVKDLKYDKIECETGQKFECQQIAISKNTKNLIFSSKNQIYIYEQDQKVYTEFNKLDENVEYIINFSFSQDSQYLVGCGSNKIIYYWDFKARKVIAKFQGHSEIVKVAKISKDNSTLASGSFDKLIRLWNLQGNFSRTIQDGHERRVNHFEFSADSLILYSGSEDKTLKFWDMQNNILSLSKDFEFIIFSFSISMDQKSLLITQGGTVELWYIQQSQTMQKSNSEIIPNGCRSYNVSIKAHIQKIQFLPNEDYFITLSINNYKQQGQQYEFSLAEIWNLQKLDEDIYPQLYQYNNITIELYQVSEDGKYVCFLDSDNELTLGYNFEIQEDNQFQKVNQLKKYNTSKIFSVAFSNDSSILSSADNLSIVFRRLQEDQLIGYFSIKIETDCFFQFFLNDNKFYYTNYQNKIFLWDVDNMIKDLQFSISEVKLDLEHLDILCFTISNNLKLLILGLQENQLRYSLSVVEMQDNKIIKTLDQNSKINILLFSDDDILLALSNELCEILIYTTEQFIIKHQLKCHQTKIIKIMFFYEETKILIEENKENNNEDKQIERFNESNQVEKIESKESDNNQDINKDHKLVQILSIISFDKNGTVVINNLEQQMIEKKPFTIQVNPDMQIQQIVLTKDIQRLAVIKQNEVQNFECSILRWDLEECYEQQKIQNCKIAQFNLDQQYLIYCTEYGDLYANYLKLKKEIKLFDSRDASQPFSILILFTTGKSILFAGNTEQILCWQIHTLENQIELIFLKKLEINQLNVLTMVINQESQIFCIGDNKIQRLDFSNAIGKLKACLIYYAEKEQMYEYQEKELIVPNIHFQNCNFSSDLSLCICVGKGNIFVDRYRNSYSRTKEQKESFTYLILWNVKTLRFTVLEESFVTKFSSDYEMFQLLMYFNDIAVFFPNKKIIVSNRDHEIIFRDCLNIDDTEFNYLNVIATINHKERIKNLIVSKDENWLASICEIGVFCLWNIIDLSKIMLTRVIYFSQEIKGFKFTNDICCYSMNLPTKDNKIYKLEYLDLKNYLAKRAFISYDYFLDFSIMPKSSIIALCGVDLILWNYETDQQKKVDLQGNSDSSINQVAFGNNNILAAAKGCDIHLIQISADTLEFNQINKLSSEQGQITCIQILRNNTILVSGSDDKTIRFWSLEQFSIIAILDGFVDTIKMITVSPNSTDMAVAMMDGSIRLYNLSFPKNFHDLTSEQIGKNAKYIQCYKIFGRQNLISAKNCIFQNTIIQQDGKALQTLFQQKNAIMMDPKQQNQN